MRKILIIIVILAIIAAVVLYFVRKETPSTETQIQYAEVTRGDIENLVSSTGALETTGTVEVGTQISGTVDKVLVDYNDVVKVDQVLAIMDTTQLHLTMESSRAELQASEAKMLRAKLEYESNQQLFENNLISEFDLEDSRISYISADASYSSKKTNYMQNRNDLDLYSVIRSPIDGIVIDRDVEEGQTVAANYSTPTLFTIAEDMSQMEIFAYVDESDIGQIKKGQEVTFTVDAFPDSTYSGSVKQVRLVPETVSNVVNYIVVISASNPDLILMPGMTATVDFIIDQKKDVLRVPITALNFQPSADVMRQVMMRKFSKRQQDGNASQSGQRPDGASQQRRARPDGQQREQLPTLWFVNEDGEMDMMFVKAGSTDGVYTEVTGPRLKEGMQVVTKMGGTSTSSSNGTKQSNGLFGMPSPGGHRR